MTPRPVLGRVATFDDRQGWGTVRDEGGHEHYFHCTAIADGTRTIAVDAAVVYVLVAGHLGQWEATAIDTVTTAV